jgi:putative membrane protein (TIGR04086 family)
LEKIKTESSFLIKITKSSLYALCISLILVLVFAFLLRFIALDDEIISPVVQIIKGVSILFGVLIGLKSSTEIGFVSGLIIGLVYTLIAFICFSMLDGFSFEFSKVLLNDIIFGGIIGGISGIIAVNFRKKS